MAGSGRIVGPGHGEALAVIGGGADPNAPNAALPAAGRIPSDIDIVAEVAVQVGIGRNHGLVVEIAAASLEAKECGGGIRPATVGGAGHRHFRSVHAKTITEEDHDVAVIEIPAGIEGE